MTYFEGFIVPVPEANKEAFRQHAGKNAPLFLEMGIARVVESWDDDVHEGKVTDFRMAVDARPDERVAFAWFEYPDREARDAALARMRTDPRMQSGDAPFDGKRMIMGGFRAIVEEGSAGGSYHDGFVVPVPQGNRDAYRELAAKMAKVFIEFGAFRVVEAIADDVPHGEVTDFYRAVKSEPDETIVFSFIEWPNKARRDEAWGKIMADESFKPEGDMPFAGQRMFWGGFEPLIDESVSGRETADA